MRINYCWVLLGLLAVYGFLLMLVASTAHSYVFDEQYYVPAAKDFTAGAVSNLEHPFLAKSFIGLSVDVVGDWWLGWRLPSILFCLGSVFLTYKIARCFVSEGLAVFSAALLCLSSVFFLVGDTAILDVFALGLGLAGVYLYLTDRFVLSGLTFGLAVLCKELAFLLLIAVGLHMVFRRLPIKKAVIVFGAAALPVLGLLWFYDLAYQPVVGGLAVNDPFTHVALVVNYQLHLNGLRGGSDVYSVWSWVTPFDHNSFNPLAWYWATYQNGFSVAWLAQPNPAVEYLMFPLLGALVFLWQKGRGKCVSLCWLWLVCSFGPWFIANFFVHLEGNFYVVYSLPALAVGCAYLYSLVRSSRLRWGLALTQLSVGVLFFLYYFPVPILR